MKNFILAFLLSLQSWSFENACYEGDGILTDSLGFFEEYGVFIEFHDDNMLVKYDFFDHGKIIDLDFHFFDNNEFEIFFEDLLVGEGFCHHDHCEYDIFIDGIEIRENLDFYQDELYRFGTMFFPDRVVEYQEYLSLFNILK